MVLMIKACIWWVSKCFSWIRLIQRTVISSPLVNTLQFYQFACWDMIPRLDPSPCCYISSRRNRHRTILQRASLGLKVDSVVLTSTNTTRPNITIWTTLYVCNLRLWQTSLAAVSRNKACGGAKAQTIDFFFVYVFFLISLVVLLWCHFY